MGLVEKSRTNSIFYLVGFEIWTLKVWNWRLNKDHRCRSHIWRQRPSIATAAPGCNEGLGHEAIGRIPLVSDCTTTADAAVQLNNSAILSLALAAIGWMALVFNYSTTSADIEERLETSAIPPMAASAMGEMDGARGELLGARGGCSLDLHCSQWRLWLLEVFGARGGCGTYGPCLGFNSRL